LTDVKVHGGIQQFTIAHKAKYTITAAGAGGGQRNSVVCEHGIDGSNSTMVTRGACASLTCPSCASGKTVNEVFGRGAVMRAIVELDVGDTLWVLVGQASDYYVKEGVTAVPWIGGSGGTFVAKGPSLATAVPIAVGGGASGHRTMPTVSEEEREDERLRAMDGTCLTQGNNAYHVTGMVAVGLDGPAHMGGGGVCARVESGFGHGGTEGCGGQRGRAISGPETAGGGAGFYGDGAASTDTRGYVFGGSAKPAKSFRNGGHGGTFTYLDLAGDVPKAHEIDGGFGGGGSGSWGGTGGGGGYSGGGGDPNTGYGGGGASYVAPGGYDASVPCLENAEGNTGAGYVLVQAKHVTPTANGEINSCGVNIGHRGPTQEQCDSTYHGQPMLTDVTVLCDGVQQFIAPTFGIYSITAFGAGGGQGDHYPFIFGRGAVVSGEVTLQEGDKLFVVVGQQSDYHFNPEYTNYKQEWVGGSGGTFVATGATLNASRPLIVAGGGSGHRTKYAPSEIMDASCTTSGRDGSGVGGDGPVLRVSGVCSALNTGFGHGGTQGCGGQRGRATSGPFTPGGGAGFYGDGAKSGDTREGFHADEPTAAKSFQNCALGGTFHRGQAIGMTSPYDSHRINGGFGGGGSGAWGGTGGGGGVSLSHSSAAKSSSASCID
jgi:hypothetical protein